MASYHRVLAIFGRSVDETTVQCDCDIPPWDIVINGKRWPGKIRLIGFVDAFFLICYSGESRFEHGIIVYKSESVLRKVLTDVLFEMVDDNNVKAHNFDLGPVALAKLLKDPITTVLVTAMCIPLVDFEPSEAYTVMSESFDKKLEEIKRKAPDFGLEPVETDRILKDIVNEIIKVSERKMPAESKIDEHSSALIKRLLQYAKKKVADGKVADGEVADGEEALSPVSHRELEFPESCQPAAVGKTGGDLGVEKDKFSHFILSSDQDYYQISSLGHEIDLKAVYHPSSLKQYRIKLRKGSNSAMKQQIRRGVSQHSISSLVNDALRLGLLTSAEVVGTLTGKAVTGSTMESMSAFYKNGFASTKGSKSPGVAE